MLQAVRRASVALQAQCMPKVFNQSRHTPAVTVKLPCNITADTFTTSAVVCEPPASAIDYTEEQIAEIRQRVFGTHIGNGLPSGRKLLRKKLIGEKVAAYYNHAEPMKDPLIANLDAERRGTQLAALKRRGKGPPKKGQGKRAGKKKR